MKLKFSIALIAELLIALVLAVAPASSLAAAHQPTVRVRQQQTHDRTPKARVRASRPHQTA